MVDVGYIQGVNINISEDIKNMSREEKLAEIERLENEIKKNRKSYKNEK